MDLDQTESISKSNSGLEYFRASIIEHTDSQGDTHTDLRIFDEDPNYPDVEVPMDSLIS